MKILIITDAYPPEIRSASHLMQELSDELLRRGYDVTVITCYPRYNLDHNASVKNYKEFSIENGIRVIRARTLPHHKVNYIIRGISNLLLHYFFIAKVRRYIKEKVDVVIVYSPPLSLYKVGYYVKKRYGAKFILNVQDIFPQNAVDLGILKNSIIIQYFKKVEYDAYKHADIITVHSEGNAKQLMNTTSIDKNKVVVLHNWVDMNILRIDSQSREFRERNNLVGKFIILFGGVIGPSQGLDFMVEIANKLRDHTDIVFLLFGDGTEKQSLIKKVRDYGLSNVYFYDFVSKEEFYKLLTEADVGLVCLSPQNKTPVVPGKILSYMAAGIPILAFLNKESDGHEIIRQSGCGYSCVSDNIDEATKLVLDIYNKRYELKKMGINGYYYALKNYSKEVCVNKLEKLF